MGKVYNSCRNRHCTVCQQKDKLQWLNKRMGELLPVGYYHLVFTIPHQLNPLCLQNKKTLYDILFKAAWQTILELTKDIRHLGADTGLISVLHTWGQNMKEHPHLHCIMPAGGLSSISHTGYIPIKRTTSLFITRCFPESLGVNSWPCYSKLLTEGNCNLRETSQNWLHQKGLCHLKAGYRKPNG